MLPQVEFSVSFKRPNGAIDVRHVLIPGGCLLADLEELVKQALKRDHDIEVCTLTTIRLYLAK